jgi:DNA (cytosine-5)-methyltransferase 1
VLDAQYFGVAQRRRRVFVVGYLGDWRAAAAVLFERHSLQGHSAPSRQKRKDLAGTIAARFGISRNNHEECVTSVTKSFYESGFAQYQQANVGGTIKAAGGVLGGGSETFLTQPIALAENTIGRQPQNGGNGDGFTDGGPMYTLNATGVHGVAQPIGVDTYNGTETGQVSCTITADVGGPTHSGPKVMQSVVAPTLTAANDPSRSPQSSEVTQQVYSVYQSSMAVRRLTPVECERLQGFPDSYTDIKSKNKPTPDGPRYKALGNSMAVPVMAWIGARIQQYEDMQ